MWRIKFGMTRRLARGNSQGNPRPPVYVRRHHVFRSCVRDSERSRENMAGPFTVLVKRFLTPSDTPCKMPGCSAPRYVDPYTERVHEFCGRSHAKEYHAMKEAQKAAEENQKWLKRQQKKQRNAKNQETGVDGQNCYCCACGGPSLAHPGIILRCCIY